MRRTPALVLAWFIAAALLTAPAGGSANAREGRDAAPVDLARLKRRQREIAHTADVLAKSGSVTDLLQVDQELAQHGGEVESFDAQRAALRARVDQATISLDLAPMAAQRCRALVTSRGSWPDCEQARPRS